MRYVIVAVSVVLVLVWLGFGWVAAYQRGDFRELSCATAGDTIPTVVLGPVSYFGSNSPDFMCDVPT